MIVRCLGHRSQHFLAVHLRRSLSVVRIAGTSLSHTSRASHQADDPLQMFQGLGIQWAATLLGCVALILVPVPVIFYLKGAEIRKKVSTSPTIAMFDALSHTNHANSRSSHPQAHQHMEDPEGPTCPRPSRGVLLEMRVPMRRFNYCIASSLLSNIRDTRIHSSRSMTHDLLISKAIQYTDDSCAVLILASDLPVASCK